MLNKDTGTILGMPSAAFGQLVMQVVAVVGLILFAIFKDGVSTGEIITTLEGIAIGTGAGATMMGLVHVWKSSASSTQAASQPQQVAATVPAQGDTPPGGVATS